MARLVSSLSSFACLGFLALLALTLLPATSGAVYTSYSDGINSGGGSCQYTGDFRSSPYFNNGLTAYVPSSKYNNGKGCSTCYEVTCKNHASCNSGSSVTVRAIGRTGDDLLLSTTAWDKIVRDRSAGRVEIKYRGVDCPSSGGMAVMVMPGSNQYWFALQVLGGAKSGGADLVELSADGGSNWKSMSAQGDGATWVLNPAKDIVGAGKSVSVRVKAVGGGQQVVLKNIIPSSWSAGKTYQSNVNFS